MPEIGEVARIVSYIQKHLVGKTLAVVKAQHDEKVFGTVGTSGAEIEKRLTGKKVHGAGQQGKYFWLTMSSPPHLVCHFGMAGWFEIKNEETAYYKVSKPKEKKWPPGYWKFILETAEEPKCEAAFVDYRRFARVRLVDCAAEGIRQVSPLKENGPDPVIDRDLVTEEWLAEKLGSKRVPIKALLLDQANISGIGNWVGDEILYHARIHPEQYSNTLSSSQVAQLYTSLDYVTTFAVETLADSSKFPENWLFKHRWGKGKKGPPPQMANGDRIVFLKVGGRTSAVVPSLQKKTGPVAGDVKDEEVDDEDGPGKESEDESEEETKSKNQKKKSVKTPSKVKNTENKKVETPPANPSGHQNPASSKAKTRRTAPATAVEAAEAPTANLARGKKRAPEVSNTAATTSNKKSKSKADKSTANSTHAAQPEESSLEKPKSEEKKPDGEGEGKSSRRRSARVSGRGL